MTTLRLQASQATKDRRAVAQDALLQQLAKLRPAEIDAWIDANYANPLAQKRLLKALTKTVAYLARRELR